MTRRIEVVTVPSRGGRDDGKMFRITEQPAMQVEKWAWKLTLAVKGTSGFVPDEVDRLGMVGVAIRGLNALLAAPIRYEDVEPLLNEMMTGVQIVRIHSQPDVGTKILPDDIEEFTTVTWLRSEVIRIHTGFSFGDALFKLLELIKTSPESQEDLPTT